MPKKPRINKQLTAGRPRSAINKAEVPVLGQLPKKILGSHMGMMQTGGGEKAPAVQGPAIGRPPKLPPRPKRAPL